MSAYNRMQSTKKGPRRQAAGYFIVATAGTLRGIRSWRITRMLQSTDEAAPEALAIDLGLKVYKLRP
jgi:hypothetical protein